VRKAAADVGGGTDIVLAVVIFSPLFSRDAIRMSVARPLSRKTGCGRDVVVCALLSSLASEGQYGKGNVKQTHMRRKKRRRK